MSKSQLREVFACDDASVVAAGLSGFSAAAGQKLIQRQKHIFLYSVQLRYNESNTEHLNVAISSLLYGLDSVLIPEWMSAGWFRPSQAFF